ncbi:hypothetical protein [Polaromonas sp. JS666]|uniref:hypothetical protein n=1 Tax=Polaromonas sp. (strain JS666 / ATCC BAA-500) TaxID=296591 RepID=UPI0000537554|nr:hypothetical protein [Polaromonas sp. JS666]ABE47374.1 hypothetical protein Bpro_5521 [Polaromonas sp. JS666]
MWKFIEVTVLIDSLDALVNPRSALLRADQITSVVDVSGAGYADGATTSITTTEPNDSVNSDDEAGGVVRSVRQLFVKDSFQTVRSMLAEALGESGSS